MFKKNSFIIFFFVVAIVLFLLYQELKTPEGIIPQGGQTDMNAQLVFWGGILAFVTAFVGLLQKIIELIIEIKKRK